MMRVALCRGVAPGLVAWWHALSGLPSVLWALLAPRRDAPPWRGGRTSQELLFPRMSGPLPFLPGTSRE
jgi:hypothetical protein